MAGTVTGDERKVVESSSRRNGMILVGLFALAAVVIGVSLIAFNSSQPPVVTGTRDANRVCPARAYQYGGADLHAGGYHPPGAARPGDHGGVGMRSGDVAGPVPVAVSFSEAMDEASAQSAFSISPSADGSFKWQGNTLVFTPKTPLNPNTAYTVTLAKNAKTRSGGTLVEVASNRFQTDPPPYPADVAQRGRE